MPKATHGQSRKGRWTGAYRAWAAMKARCYMPSQDSYPMYGGRGITVCDRWQTFENFYADMGERPAGMTLDRIDTDGNYEPGNCRWATPSEQVLNRRHLPGQVVHNGRTVREWAAIWGLSYHGAYLRIKNGSSVRGPYRKNIKP